LPADRGDGAFFARFRQWLLDQLTIHDPRLMVYEAPLITGARTHFQTVFRLMGLCSHVEEIGHIREIRTERANNQTVKRFLTGSGRAEKIDMLESCRQRGYDPPDHNAADAIGIFLYAEAKHAPQVTRAAGVLFAASSL
jgi:Holliday junction resolvasome RuvABC endonuclease subunit